MFRSRQTCGRLGILVVQAVVMGCNINEAPSVEKLHSDTNPSKAFIFSERDIQGIYGNSDVDSAIYQYTSNESTAEKFWERVAARAEESNWAFAADQEKTRRYLRIRPRTGQQRFHSVEEVRIACDARTMKVTVAWVQADTSDLPDDLPEDGEGDFAKREIWPKFEELTR